MIAFTESTTIRAPPNAVWAQLSDIERWWPASNPDHVAIEVRTRGASVGVGTEVVFEERVAGVSGRAEGTITQWIPGIEAAWEGAAVYRRLGLSVPVREGVIWRIERRGETSLLVAGVWATFPPGCVGRLLEWAAKSLLHVVRRDRAHARRELSYLKAVTEESIYRAAPET